MFIFLPRFVVPFSIFPLGPISPWVCFWSRRSPWRLSFPFRKQFVLESSTGSLEQERWPTVTQKGSFARKVLRDRRFGKREAWMLLGKRKYWNTEALWLVCLLCCLKSAATDLQTLPVVHMWTKATKYECWGCEQSVCLSGLDTWICIFLSLVSYWTCLLTFISSICKMGVRVCLLVGLRGLKECWIILGCCPLGNTFRTCACLPARA